MKIGFVGLGNMGYNMVNNLIKNGFEVYTYDLFATAIERTVAIGAHGVKSLKELAEICDVVQVMVMNYAQVQSVALDADGLLASMKKGSILSVSSIISPAQMREIAREAKNVGVGYADCPVSGGKTGAVEGELIIITDW